jgi:hypothetical protein
MSKHKVVLNLFATSRHRNSGYCRLKELIDIIKDEIDCCVLVLCSKKMGEVGESDMEFLENDKTFISDFESVLESVSF